MFCSDCCCSPFALIFHMVIKMLSEVVTFKSHHGFLKVDYKWSFQFEYMYLLSYLSLINLNYLKDWFWSFMQLTDVEFVTHPNSKSYFIHYLLTQLPVQPHRFDTDKVFCVEYKTSLLILSRRGELTCP